MIQQPRPLIQLHFGNEVYQDETKADIPFNRGIYVAYSGKFNGEHVELNNLLYIGMGDDTTIAQRIHDHTVNQHSDWKKLYCEDGEAVFYLCAPLDHDIRDVEASMIFRHKPCCNSNDKDRYNGSLPAPNITTDLALPDINGAVTDVLSWMEKLNHDGNGYV